MVWLLGYLGVAMSAEIGACLGGLALGFGVAVGQHGLFPLVNKIIWGPEGSRRRTARDARNT
jgi:amino acid transporter